MKIKSLSIRTLFLSSHPYTVDKYAWDNGGHNDPKVTIYLTENMEGVSAVKDRVSCEFDEWGFDLKVMGLNGVNYRFLKDNLEHKIVPSESKFIVKKNGINIKLAKAKGDLGILDAWTKLESKKTKAQKEADANKAAGAVRRCRLNTSD